MERASSTHFSPKFLLGIPLFYRQISFDIQDSLVVYSGHQKANSFQYVNMQLLISGKAVVELNGRNIKHLRSRAYKELLIKLLEEGHKKI